MFTLLEKAVDVRLLNTLLVVVTVNGGRVDDELKEWFVKEMLEIGKLTGGRVDELDE